MAKHKIEVSMVDTEVVKNLLSNVWELVNQISENNYVDELGHELKNNKAYVDLLDSLNIQEL